MDTIEDNLYKEQIPNICTALKSGAQKFCRPTTVTKKFPILKWLPHYKAHYLFRDMVAGFTVGLTTIPQAIAYGVVAGLEPQYGLYSAFMGCFMYIIFGSCKDVTIATTAIMALMVHDYAVISPDYPVFICFFAGCIILLLGLLNLGVLVRFISIPVITGFTFAAALTIGSAQINNLFGMKSPSNAFLKAWSHFFTHLSSIRINDALLGVSTVAFLILMKKAKDIPLGNRSVWKYISLSRNALAVIFGTFLAYILSRDGSESFRVTGKIVPGLPPFQFPPFSTNINGTEVPFKQMLRTVGTSFAAVPLVAILEIVAISKAFSKGKVVDASQEMVALGFCNILGSFVLSMPVTGSFTRTAVNNASGVRTPLGGAVTGCLVLMALAFLTKTFYFIPKSTLAAVIIAAMISLVELNKISEMWKAKKTDLFPFVVTTLTCIFWNLEYGILCGVGANLSFVVVSTARPQIDIVKEKITGHEIGLIKIKQRLDYAAAEYLQEKVLKFANKNADDLSLIIIDGQEVNAIDYTVAKNIISLKEDLELLKCNLICYKWNISSAGVICRLDKRLRVMFRFNSTLDEIVTDHYQKVSSVGSSSTSLSVL